MSGNSENSNQIETAPQALENSGEAASVNTKGPKARKGRRPDAAATKAVWKSADDAILVATLIKERELGHQTDSGFKPITFTACAEALRGSELTSGGAPKTSGSARDHWDKLKKDFRTVKAIRESSGFGWDDTKKICTAPNDVWEKYIQAHSKAKMWRTKSFPLYDSIHLLVDGIIATGENAFHAGMAPREFVGDTSIEMTDRDSSSSEEDTFITPVRPPRRKHSAIDITPLASASAKRKQTHGCSIGRAHSGRSGNDAMFSVAGAIETLADTFIEPSGDPSTLTSPQRRTAAIAKLEDDADLSDTEQVKAIRLFSRNTFIADSYLAISKKSTRTLYIQSEMEEP